MREDRCMAATTLTLADIRIRDPFLVTDAQAGRYVLFGTTDPEPWSGPGVGFDAYVSDDLETYQRRGAKQKGSLRRLMREAQPFLVAVRLQRKNELMDKGVIQPLIDDVVWRWTGDYDEKLGIQDHRIDVGSMIL